LKETTGDKGAKGMMAFKLKKPEDAANVVAFLASLAPAADAAAAPAP
jgi:cytochrome c